MNIRTSTLLLLVMMAGCATQRYEPMPLEADSAVTFTGRTLSDAGMGEVSVWGLPELTQAALRLHPDLDVARAEWRASQAAVNTAGQKSNPVISTSGEHHSLHRGTTPWTLNLGIDIPIETHNKRGALIEQANALSEAARFEIAQVMWKIRSRVRDRFLALYATQQRATQIERELALQQSILDLLQARVNAGITPATDLADAKLIWQKMQLELKAERVGESEALVALAAAVGLPENALKHVPMSYAIFEQINDFPAHQVQQAALLNHIKIRQALANYQAAEARLKLEIARQYPDFILSPGLSWDQADFKWSLGLSFVLGMLNKNEGPIAEADAARKVEMEKFNALQAEIIGAQAQAYTRWRGALQEIDNVEQLISSQRARMRQTQRSFDAGYTDRLQLIMAQQALISTESARISANLKFQHKLGLLENTVQQPLDGSEPIPEPPDDQELAP